MNNNKNFYVYKLEHIETKEFYFGSRGCKCLPEEDVKYMGSMHTWKPDKSKLIKIIIETNFETRTDALIYEASLIKENIDNDLNRNYHIPNTGYRSDGMVTVKDYEGNTLQVSKDDPKYLSGELTFIAIGKVNVKDSNDNTFQVNCDDPGFLSGEFVNINKGKVPVKDSKGNIFQVNCDDPRFLSGELININKGKTVVKDFDNNIFQVEVDDPRLFSGELVGIVKNKITVIDKDGNTFQIDYNDPRYLSGEVVSIIKGKVGVKDKNGLQFMVNVDDPRYLSGELIAISKGRIPWNKGIKTGEISQEQKDKISESIKIALSKPETKEKMLKNAEKRRGVKRGPMSQESKAKLSKANKGKMPPNARKILCLNNNIIYDSISQCAKLLNLKASSIGNVLSGRTKYIKGYSFKYYIE